MFALIPYTHEVQTAIAHDFPAPPVRGAATMPALSLVQHLAHEAGWWCEHDEPTILRMEIPFLHHERSGPSYTKWSWHDDCIFVDNGMFSGLLWLLHSITQHTGPLCCWDISGHPVFVLDPAMDWVAVSHLFAEEYTMPYPPQDFFYQRIAALYPPTTSD